MAIGVEPRLNRFAVPTNKIVNVEDDCLKLRLATTVVPLTLVSTSRDWQQNSLRSQGHASVVRPTAYGRGVNW